MTAIGDLIKTSPQIIAEAAKSPLGIAALMILALSILALFLFRSAPLAARVGTFVLLLLGFGTFAFAITGASSFRPPTTLGYTEFYRKAAAAFDAEDFQTGLTHLDQALRVLSEKDARILTPKEVDARRRFLVASRALWRAYRENSRDPAILFDNTRRHLREAIEQWSLIPANVLPTDDIDQTMLRNSLRYMCAEQIQRYLREEDLELRGSVCRQLTTSMPILVADKHLSKPPTIIEPARQREEPARTGTSVDRAMQFQQVVPSPASGQLGSGPTKRLPERQERPAEGSRDKK